MQTLLIVESPAKCAKIVSYLGSGYTCIASFGHIRRLISVDPEDQFKTTFEIINEKQVTKIKKAIKNANEVFLATDDDREGEAIAWHICDVFGLSTDKTKRIKFHEITKPALEHAVRNPTVVDMNLVRAQQSRQIVDMLVGFQVSPVLWRHVSSRKKLSAGRCQTPALRLLYENDKAVQASAGTMQYATTGYFTSLALPFQLNHHYIDAPSITHFLTKSATHEHVLHKQTPQIKTHMPPTPFNTSKLQQAASNELKFSPTQTMRLCQTLYEGGFITYMRTESVEYSDEFYANADKYVIKTYGIEYVPERNGLKQNLPHEAIRPTDILVETALDGKERRLYKLIRRNTIESVMRPATVSTLEVNVTAPENHAYKYVAENVVFRGWYVVSGRNVNKHAYGHLMHLSEGTPLSYKKITSQMSVVGIKPHYTEARLVQLLEQKGIGRPSTFASLVEKNIERGYIKKTNLPGKSTTCTDFELSDDGELVEHSTTKTFGVEKNKLAMEPLGAMVAEFLYDQFGLLFAYDYTEKMEDALDRIARGEHEWLEICTLCQETLHKLTGDVKPKKEEQFIIDDSHTYLIGKHGPVIKKTNSKTTFLSVKQNVVVDIDRLRAGTYSIDDLVEHENCVGMHEKKPILLKHGKFGDYIEWNGERVNVSKLTNISVETVVPLLNQTRMIDANTSVRKGKTGDYIYYKTPQMKKPQFIGLQKFAGDARTCSKTEICCFVNKMLK